MKLNKTKFLAVGLVIVAAVIIKIRMPQSEKPADVTAANGESPRLGKPANDATKSGGTASRQPRLAEGTKIQTQAMVEEREAALELIHDASVTYDPAELPVIQPYLLSPDPEIRAAAVDAMVVLGDAAASPLLREAAVKMTSTKEAAAMMEAAAYVELPPLDIKKFAALAKKKRDEKKQAGQKTEERGDTNRKKAPPLR